MFLDSELVAADLLEQGYELVDTARQADTILFNTCSVASMPKTKSTRALGRLKQFKEHRPDIIIGVMGCMAQKDQEQIFQRAPHVDLVVGTGPVTATPGTSGTIASALRYSSLSRPTFGRCPERDRG